MADDTTQRALHKFLSKKLQNVEPFTKQDIKNITGWSDIIGPMDVTVSAS